MFFSSYEKYWNQAYDLSEILEFSDSSCKGRIYSKIRFIVLYFRVMKLSYILISNLT